MTQQLSPWLETAYGWSYGESGWNSGMDSNLLKFSVMFDRNVDSIISLLPPAVNGQVHYNTTDNRLYFAVGTTYFSTPVPKWFTVVVRSTGATWQYDGTSLVEVQSVGSLDSRLDAVELTVASLGSAAFEDVSAFATQAELDVVEGQSQAYTDVLRDDLADPTGAELIGRGAGTVETCLDALEADVSALQLVSAEYVRPSDKGAVGDGVADDTAAVLATIQDGRPIYWGDDSKVYRTTAMISHTLSRAAVWISSGATIKVDSPSSIHRAINITSPGFDFYSRGKLVIDCNLKAYNGFYLYNATAFSDCRIDDIFVRKVYRSGTTFTGGDGIWIRGAFRNVLLIRPDVCNVLMATGAGISGSQGIAGITVSSAGIGLAPQEVTILHPYIDGVYSEDATYMVDQDGIRIFGEEDLVGETIPLESHFLISGGKIRNARGRSIKSQMEFGTVDGVQITRDNTGLSLMNGAGTMPEIDFQVGGGLIRNVEIKYKGSVPNRVVKFSGVRTAGKLGAGCVARDIRIALSGGTDLPSFASIVTFEGASSSYNLCDIYYSGSRNFGANFINVTNDIDGRTVLLSLENIQARITSSFRFVNKTAAIGTVRAVGRNIHNISNTTTFLVSAGGTTQTLLEGINVGVSL